MFSVMAISSCAGTDRNRQSNVFRPGLRIAAMSLAVALGLVATLTVSTAYAGDKVTHTSSKKFLGQHMALLTGFTGSSPSVVAYFLDVDRRNGSVFLGTQRWLDCGNSTQGCAKSRAQWSEPEIVAFVRTAPNTYILRSNNGMGQLTLNKDGVVKAYFLGGGNGLKKLRTTGWVDGAECGGAGETPCPPPPEVAPPPPPQEAPPVTPPMTDPDAPPPYVP